MASPASQKPLKGILKKTSAAAPPPPRDPSQDPRNRELALQHARILQDRKDTEAQITANIEALSEWPRDRGPGWDAARPSPADAAGFRRLVRTMQPSDYDDLVAERNACGLCGYALCPRPRRRYPGSGGPGGPGHTTYKLVNMGRRDFDIVETRELERWCSQACTRRALYIKVQLNETAAWERQGIPEIQIDLMDEPPPRGEGGAVGGEEEKKKKEKDDEGTARRGEADRLAVEVSRLKLEHERKAAKDLAALAAERGEGDEGAPSRRKVDVVIREKKVTAGAEAPSLDDPSASARHIEGYEAKFGAAGQGTE